MRPSLSNSYKNYCPWLFRLKELCLNYLPNCFSFFTSPTWGSCYNSPCLPDAFCIWYWCFTICMWYWCFTRDESDFLKIVDLITCIDPAQNQHQIALELTEFGFKWEIAESFLLNKCKGNSLKLMVNLSLGTWFNTLQFFYVLLLHLFFNSFTLYYLNCLTFHCEVRWRSKLDRWSFMKQKKN